MAKVIQTGNSFVVTIPKKFAKMVGIAKGDNVKIEKRPQKGQLVFYFSGPQQLVINNQVLKLKRTNA